MNNEQLELLTLAAKAMDLNGQWLPFIVKVNGVKINTGDVLHANDKIWNPFTSGDDLLDMMGQLMIEPLWDDDFVYCHVPSGQNENRATVYFRAHNNSRREALAWAAVRVAAEIGRRMK